MIRSEVPAVIGIKVVVRRGCRSCPPRSSGRRRDVPVPVTVRAMAPPGPGGAIATRFASSQPTWSNGSRSPSRPPIGRLCRRIKSSSVPVRARR